MDPFAYRGSWSVFEGKFALKRTSVLNKPTFPKNTAFRNLSNVPGTVRQPVHKTNLNFGSRIPFQCHS